MMHASSSGIIMTLGSKERIQVASKSRIVSERKGTTSKQSYYTNLPAAHPMQPNQKRMTNTKGNMPNGPSQRRVSHPTRRSYRQPAQRYPYLPQRNHDQRTPRHPPRATPCSNGNKTKPLTHSNLYAHLKSITQTDTP